MTNEEHKPNQTSIIEKIKNQFIKNFTKYNIVKAIVISVFFLFYISLGLIFKAPIFYNFNHDYNNTKKDNITIRIIIILVFIFIVVKIFFKYK